jgi:hypothetical protein
MAVVRGWEGEGKGGREVVLTEIYRKEAMSKKF